MNEDLMQAALLAMLVALGACSAASNAPKGVAKAARVSVQVGVVSMPPPQAPYDATPITPKETVGAAHGE